MRTSIRETVIFDSIKKNTNRKLRTIIHCGRWSWDMAECSLVFPRVIWPSLKMSAVDCRLPGSWLQNVEKFENMMKSGKRQELCKQTLVHGLFNVTLKYHHWGHFCQFNRVLSVFLFFFFFYMWNGNVLLPKKWYSTNPCHE